MVRIISGLTCLALCAPLAAVAAEAFVGADISLQAGPDPDYPQIVELTAGTPVQIEGCIDGFTWCDVLADGERGWIPGTFLEEVYNDAPVVIIDYGPRIGIPIVSFSIGVYWDHYYRSRPFYAQRAQWVSRNIVVRAPPHPAHLVATRPNGSPPAHRDTGHPASTSTSHAKAAPKSEDKSPAELRSNESKTAAVNEAESKSKSEPRPVTPEMEPQLKPTPKPAPKVSVTKPEPKPKEEPKPKPRDELKPLPSKEDQKKEDEKKDKSDGGG